MTSTVDTNGADPVEPSVRETLEQAVDAAGLGELRAEIEDRVRRDLDPEVAAAAIKEAMLTEDLETTDVRIRAGLVTVRALTSARIKFLKKIKKDDDEFEVLLVAESLLVPTMTAAEVKTWAARHRAGDYVKVLTAVQRISGLDEEAQKSGVEEV